MNETEAIVLNLSNQDSIAKIWNVGGKDLGLPVLRPKLVLPLLTEDTGNLPPEYLFFYGEGQKGNSAINFLNEKSNNNEEENNVRTEIENINANVLASPLKVNKIRIYTDNTEQLKELFIYYKQDAEGNYIRTLLHIIQYYRPEFPRAKIEITKKDIGTIVLDGNKRLEVNVLANTILIVELLFELEDPNEEPLKTEEEAETSEDESEAKNEAKESKELEDMANIKEFVDKYYRFSKDAALKTKIPPLFALGQAALESGFSINRPGNNLFGIKATNTWKGKTIALPTNECTKTDEKIIQTIQAPNKICGEKIAYKVTAFFRAYESPIHSFIDHGKFLQSNRYKEAFKYSDKPFDFAKEIVKAGYATDPDYNKKIKEAMLKIQPYIIEKQTKIKIENKDEYHKRLFLAIGAGVLILLLYFIIVKSTFTKSPI